ncbi:MAG: hypothetical protein FWF59_00220 [Turicibacter sp.]|nr:hypothetical protein [Turicibacter sp.]
MLPDDETGLNLAFDSAKYQRIRLLVRMPVDKKDWNDVLLAKKDIQSKGDVA